MTAPDVFQRVVHALDAAGIPYMLTGSFASAYHAVPRATHGIDLVIAPTREQLAALARAFPPPAYYCDAAAALEAFERESLFNVIDLATGWKIDFIMRKSREYSRTEFARRQHVVFEGLDRVCHPERQQPKWIRLPFRARAPPNMPGSSPPASAS